MQVGKSEDLQVRTQDLSFCVIHFVGVHAAWSAVKQMKDSCVRTEALKGP
jgi:hypothetical protein